MAYQANFTIKKTKDISIFRIEDISIGDETILTRIIKIVKTDLTESSYTFTAGINFIDVNIPKDLVLHCIFTSTVTTIVTNSKYIVTKDFLTRNFIELKISKRFIDLKVNKLVLNEIDHINTTMEISFYIASAEDRIRFSDLKGAQEIIDFANDIAVKY